LLISRQHGDRIAKVSVFLLTHLFKLLRKLLEASAHLPTTVHSACRIRRPGGAHHGARRVEVGAHGSVTSLGASCNGCEADDLLVRELQLASMCEEERSSTNVRAPSAHHSRPTGHPGALRV
jgi:hypothetical protein